MLNWSRATGLEKLCLQGDPEMPWGPPRIAGGSGGLCFTKKDSALATQT